MPSRADRFNNVYIADLDNQRIRVVNGEGVINTFAGNGNAGFSGDGELATTAELNFPEGVDSDILGNVYIADTLNHRIRKVDAVTGIISTFAGKGTAGYSGDGGPAIHAELNQPSDISIDSLGNVYIADSANHVIRKIDPAGNITTFAGKGTSGYSGDGGKATQAELNEPLGVRTDRFQGVFIGDAGNHAIREVIVSQQGLAGPAGVNRGTGPIAAPTEAETIIDPSDAAGKGSPKRETIKNHKQGKRNHRRHPLKRHRNA